MRRALSIETPAGRCGSGSVRPRDPDAFQHRVHDEIDVVVVKPFGFSQDPFRRKSQPLGDGAAFQVTGRALQDDAIAVLFAKRVVREARCRSRHNASALMLEIDPVADFRSAVERVDVMLSNDAGKPAIAHDDQSEPIIVFGLFNRAADKPCGIYDAGAVVQPG